MLTKLVLALFSCFFSQDPDIQVLNAGIGGNTSKDLLARVQQDVVDQKPDLTIIMIGTNDVINSKKLLSYETYRQNLITIVKNLQDKKIKVILVSPPPVDTIYVFERHTRAVFAEPPNNKLKKISNLVKEVAKQQSVQFIDLNKFLVDAGLPKHNLDDMIRNEKNSGKRDGVHPTPKGYQLIANFIFDELVAKQQIRNKSKIVCFGDSITKGAAVQPNESYPAVLLELIKNFLKN